MQELVEDFLQYLRNERGQSENTQRTYAALLGKFVIWADAQSLKTWTAINLSHLMAFLQHEQKRRSLSHPMGEGQGEGSLFFTSVFIPVHPSRDCGIRG